MCVCVCVGGDKLQQLLQLQAVCFSWIEGLIQIVAPFLTGAFSYHMWNLNVEKPFACVTLVVVSSLGENTAIKSEEQIVP